MKEIHLHTFNTGFGTIRTAATDRGLALLVLPGVSRDRFEKLVAGYYVDHDISEANTANLVAAKQITEYLNGDRRSFRLKLDIQGTPFQIKTLQQVARIPYGKTMTYGQVAAAVGHPGAARAVGSANARNRLPLVIPCHRVVASNGIGGYGGGKVMKRKLLLMERAL
ncbi:MAG: methylated-DNA--[protein]-cysteine S-methyltransferase [Candidatus Zixiibacteriota bacterium]|nr:MAG: methylated-DNA--[protein]-cysteine S-methyltransferase [candidate division Zixibacteria bacterium]